MIGNKFRQFPGYPWISLYSQFKHHTFVTDYGQFAICRNQSRRSAPGSKYTGTDTYLGSTAYLTMTGRNGLTLYSDGIGTLASAVPPNRPDTTLVFPPFGNPESALLKRTASSKTCSETHTLLHMLCKQNYSDTYSA